MTTMNIDLAPKALKKLNGGEGGSYASWSPNHLPMLHVTSIDATPSDVPSYSDSSMVAYVLEEKAKRCWEREFCKMNGIGWKKLVKVKKSILTEHAQIVRWNDSAGKEAFQNAKARYWAQINGIEPETILPDLEMLVEEEMNFDAALLHPELYETVRGSISDDEYDGEDDEGGIDWGEGGVILLDEHYYKWKPWYEVEDHPIIATGWSN